MLLRQRLFPGAFFAADFLRRQYRLNGVRYRDLSSVAGISITRATTGYALTQQGQLVSFPSGAARITDRGLLVEGAASNLTTYSQTFANAAWVSAGTISMSPVDNQAVAPDGTTTAAELQEENTASGTRAIINNFTSVSGTTYALSVYAKAGTATAVQVLGGSAGFSTGVWATFNLSTGAVGASGASTTASIQALANGWYRCTVIGAATASSASAGIGIVMVDSPTASRLPTYAPAQAKSCYIWQAQTEATAYATSPIVTTSGSAPRNADVISVGSVTGLSLPYTVYAKYRRAYDSGAEQILIQLDDGTANERCRLVVGSTDVFRAIMTDGGSDTADESVAGALAVGTTYNGAARFQVNNVIACRAGTLSSGDVSATVPDSPTNIRIGGGISGANAFGGYLEQLAVYPSAYANAALQALAPA